MSRFYYLLTLSFLMVASSCKKDTNGDFPNVSFEEYIYINNPSSIDLQTIGGSIFQNRGGYKGLIIYRRYLNQNSADFAAYDLACPQHYDNDCGVLEESSDPNFVKCSCNGEEYLLFDGSPGTNAERALIPYPTTFDGSIIIVRN